MTQQLVANNIGVMVLGQWGSMSVTRDCDSVVVDLLLLRLRYLSVIRGIGYGAVKWETKIVFILTSVLKVVRLLC